MCGMKINIGNEKYQNGNRQDENCIWYVENVFYSGYDWEVRDLTLSCPSPPLFYPFPKIYTKIIKKHVKTRGNGGRGGPPRVET